MRGDCARKGIEGWLNHPYELLHLPLKLISLRERRLLTATDRLSNAILCLAKVSINRDRNSCIDRSIGDVPPSLLSRRERIGLSFTHFSWNFRKVHGDRNSRGRNFCRGKRVNVIKISLTSVAIIQPVTTSKHSFPGSCTTVVVARIFQRAQDK